MLFFSYKRKRQGQLIERPVKYVKVIDRCVLFEEDLNYLAGESSCAGWEEAVRRIYKDGKTRKESVRVEGKMRRKEMIRVRQYVVQQAAATRVTS